ncbi:hypothetical protein D9Y22_05940 [Methylorubrum sp. DB1722]|nr:hypothetical protein [Methylorubrum sp. DB1722]
MISHVVDAMTGLFDIGLQYILQNRDLIGKNIVFNDLADASQFEPGTLERTYFTPGDDFPKMMRPYARKYIIAYCLRRFIFCFEQILSCIFDAVRHICTFMQRAKNKSIKLF